MYGVQVGFFISLGKTLRRFDICDISNKNHHDNRYEKTNDNLEFEIQRFGTSGIFCCILGSSFVLYKKGWERKGFLLGLFFAHRWHFEFRFLVRLFLQSDIPLIVYQKTSTFYITLLVIVYHSI